MKRKTQDARHKLFYSLKDKNKEPDQAQDEDQDYLGGRARPRPRPRHQDQDQCQGIFVQHLSTSMLSLKLTSWLIPCTLR